jgi:hypothetical protein
VVENDTIRLIDVVIVAGDATGSSAIVELDNKDDPRFAPFAALLGGRMALLTPEDREYLAAQLPPDTTGLVMLFEHRWAEQIKDAIAEAGGRLVGRSVVPPEVLAALSDELEAHIAALPAARS